MMRILYECRGITLADTGEGYAILFTEILQTEMLRRVERYEQKKKAEL